MPIQVTCAHCGKKMQAPDSLAGKKARCANCKQVIDLPAAPPVAPGAVPGKPAGDAMGELARALEEASIKPAKVEGPAGAGPAAGPPPEEVSVAPAAPPTVATAESAPEAAVAAAPAAAEPGGKAESDELIAMPPVGVQTPSGLSTAKRAALAQTYRWQRRLAAAARTGGFILAMLLLLLGTATMLFLVIYGGPAMLAPGLAIVLLTSILAVVLALAGLLARHTLLLLADLSEDARRKQELLDQISERLE